MVRSMKSHQTADCCLRVLVVDDIESSRQDLCHLLRDLGHEVIEAASGATALVLALESKPDIVLLDLLMPDLDGFEVTRQLRVHVTERWLPVIVTSSLQGDEHFIRALQGGADDYLSRPVQADLLNAKLRHYHRVLGMQAQVSAMAGRQQSIHDNILDAVITLDEQGVIEEANRAACTLFGAPGDLSLRGQACDVVMGATLSQLQAGKDIQLRRHDQALFPAEVSLSQWREGGTTRHTVVVHDLTERRHIERLKDEFLAMVSHELRTPLTSILGALGLLAAGTAGEMPPAAGVLIDMAHRNGERLSHLVDDILDLTKLEGNRMVLHTQTLRLGPLLREALAANQGYADPTGVKLQLQAEDDGPEVCVDQGRFMQVMANLLSNAIKYSPAGGVVEVSLSVAADGVCVAVRDHGSGIDPVFRARMFEKFSQADGSDRRKQGGTGLGLYVSRMLVERMEGRITVESVAGAGATFSVHFPFAHALDQEQPAWILLIDADLDSRDRVARSLAGVCRVESAANLDQAREYVGRGRPPMVMADPQAQGRADVFCAALRRLASGQPVMLYTDSVDAMFVQRMGLAWVRKARTSHQELMNAIMQALKQSPIRRAS